MEQRSTRIRPRSRRRRRRAREYRVYPALIERCAELEPVTTAVAHPCDESSLTAAVEAAEAELIRPILVGPAAKIRAVAEQFGLDLGAYRLVDAPHSHAAAAKAVEIVRAGEAETLMKGSLHTDELMAEVVRKETGLRTERRISHVFIMDVPTYPKPLVVTDAAINIFPDLETKVDIVQNAIDMAHALGRRAAQGRDPLGGRDRDAQDPLDDRCRGALQDGRARPDHRRACSTARSPSTTRSARRRRRSRASAPRSRAMPTSCVVPDLEAGNMLAKQLSFLANADAAGIVLGARVPIILTSRADTVRARMASCAVAVLLAHARRQQAGALAAE